jgi:hypothetical protein
VCGKSLAYKIKSAAGQELDAAPFQAPVCRRNTGQAERLPLKKTVSFLADCHALFSPGKGHFYANQ